MEYYVRIKMLVFRNALVWWAKMDQGYSAYIESTERFTEARQENFAKKTHRNMQMCDCHLIDA